MLVLSRKQGEALELPEIGVSVEVVALKTSKVQLGIQAPREITVLRREQTSGLHATAVARKHENPRRLDRERFLETITQIESQLGKLSAGSEPGDVAVLRKIIRSAAENLGELRNMIGSLDALTPHKTTTADTLPIHQQTSNAVGQRKVDADADSVRPESVSKNTCVRQREAAYQIRPSLSLQHVA